MLKQAAVLLAAVCWCLASVSGQRVCRPHPQKLDGFVAITHNGTEVRAVRGVTIAIKVAGGEGQASTRTSNGRIIVEMNYINGSQLDSCKFIHGRFKLRHFYRKFLNYAPFNPFVQRAMADRHNGSPEVVLVAVIAQGVLELKGFQRWTGAMIKEYGAMTNYSRAVHECRMWRKKHLSVFNVSSDNMPHLSHEDGASSDEDDVEDDDDDDEEGDDEIIRPLSEIDAISNSSSYGARAFGRRNVTVLPLDRKYILSSDKRNSTFWFDRRNGTDTRNGTVSNGRHFVSIDRKNVVSKWNWNGTAADWRNATAGDRIRPVQPVVRAQNATVIDRRFGEVEYRWNVTTGDKYDRKNITRKMHQGRSKRHSMRRGPQHPHPHHHHGFVAVQGADASLPGTSEVRAARHGKLGMQTRVTTRDHNHVLVTETTNGETIVKTIAREGDSDELEDCDIIRGPLKMRKFYRKFLDDAPLGPAVVRATARRGHLGGPNGTHPHPHYRHHSNKMAVDRVTNRARHSLNDSAHSWNDTLLDEYGQLTSFRKQMRRCKQWRKEHGRHHLTNQTTDATSPDTTSQSEEEKADHVIEGKRVKRQLYAGTKWCGAGSSTQDEKDMGHHREVDKCCQKHDECPYNIEAFTTKWGLFNHRLTTISLCECDFRFRTCLRNVGTETADSVGYIFFEVVSPTCFNFRYEDVCVERTWYGKCTRTERQPRAVSRESLSFN